MRFPFAVAFIEELAVLALVCAHRFGVWLAFVKSEVTGAGFFTGDFFVTVCVTNETHVVDAIVLAENVNLGAGKSTFLPVDGLEFDVSIFFQFRLSACLVRDGKRELAWR